MTARDLAKSALVAITRLTGQWWTVSVRTGEAQEWQKPELEL